MTNPSATWPPTPMHSAKIIHSRIIVMTNLASWEAIGEAGTGNQIDDGSVIPLAS